MRQLPEVRCGITWQAFIGAAYLGQSLPVALGKAQQATCGAEAQGQQSP